MTLTVEPSFVQPDTWPDTQSHRMHMDSWCDGLLVRPTGGVGIDPHLNKVHLQHHIGYCAARAAVHSLADGLWAGPSLVYQILLVVIVAACFLCYQCVRCLCCSDQKPSHLM